MSRTKPFSSAKVRQALADDVDAFVSGGGTVVECPPGEKRFKWRPVVFTGEGGAYIYFIQSGADGPIKIGYTNDIEARFSGLQIGNHETGSSMDPKQWKRRYTENLLTITFAANGSNRLKI